MTNHVVTKAVYRQHTGTTWYRDREGVAKARERFRNLTQYEWVDTDGYLHTFDSKQEAVEYADRFMEGA